jgi:hypothetical protein
MLGIELGAGGYETRVWVPLWSGDPQAAYRFFAANPQYAARPGELWWLFCTPLTGLVGVGLLLTARWLPRPQSLWAMLAAGMAIVLVLSALVWFVPHIIQLQSGRVLLMTPEQAQAMGAGWARWNLLRLPWCLAAWCAAVYAVSLGLGRRLRPNAP